MAGFLYHVGGELFRTAVVGGGLNDTQIWVKLEFEGVKPIRQAFSYGF
jgi:hypothetical protein